MINLPAMVGKNRGSNRRGGNGGAGGRARILTGPYAPLAQAAALLPLLVLYEVAALFLARQSYASVIDFWFQRLLSMVGLTAYYLPGVLVLIILVLAHIYRGDPWRVRADSVGKLWAEAVLWTVPLVVLYLLFTLPIGRLMGAMSLAETGAGRLCAAIVFHTGAGLFEEFVFRLVLISGLLFLLRRLLSVSEVTAEIVAVCASAAVFAAAHYAIIGGHPYSRETFFFRTAAGIYLGIMYISRGFATAVIIHTTFNVVLVASGGV